MLQLTKTTVILAAKLNKFFTYRGVVHPSQGNGLNRLCTPLHHISILVFVYCVLFTCIDYDEINSYHKR